MDNSTDEIAYRGKDKTFLEEIYKGWEGYSLICGDGPEGAKLNLAGTEVSMKNELL